MIPPTLTATETDKAKTDTSKHAFSLSEGILIATASSVAYLLTFQYEKGFVSYWGVPAQFVSVGLVNVLYAAVLLIGFIFLAASLVNLVVQLLPVRFFDNPVASRRLVDVGVSSLLPFAAPRPI